MDRNIPSKKITVHKTSYTQGFACNLGVFAKEPVASLIMNYFWWEHSPVLVSDLKQQKCSRVILFNLFHLTVLG